MAPRRVVGQLLAMLRRAYPRIPSPRNDFWRDD